jgi:hypothetical protein
MGGARALWMAHAAHLANQKCLSTMFFFFDATRVSSDDLICCRLVFYFSPFVSLLFPKSCNLVFFVVDISTSIIIL